MTMETIDFPDFDVALCGRHADPFRAKWPKGAGLLAVALLQAVMADERMIEHFEKDADGKAVLHHGRASLWLREFSPLCCFVGDEKMTALTEAALHPETRS